MTLQMILASIRLISARLASYQDAQDKKVLLKQKKALLLAQQIQDTQDEVSVLKKDKQVAINLANSINKLLK